MLTIFSISFRLLLENFDADQMSRYEAFRRSNLNKAAVKKVPTIKFRIGSSRTIANILHLPRLPTKSSPNQSLPTLALSSVDSARFMSAKSLKELSIYRNNGEMWAPFYLII